MTKIAILLKTDTVLTPFGEDPQDAFFSGQTIGDFRTAALKAAGFQIKRAQDAREALETIRNTTGACLLLPDNTFITKRALKSFVRQSRKSALTKLRLKINAAVDYLLPLQNVAVEDGHVTHRIYWVDGADLPEADDGIDTWLKKIDAQAEATTIAAREVVVEVPLPSIRSGERNVLQYPITSTIVASVEHWTHVLWLNQIAFGVRWIETIGRHPLWALLKAISALSANRDRLLARFVRRGRNVQIHPTADVSGSIIGDNVRIGPHATVRNSIVGDNTTVLDHCALINCVIGESCLITEGSVLVSVVSYPEATIGNYKLQVSLIGRGAYINAWAGLIDAKFNGTIKVQKNGALADSQRAFMGSVVGHRAQIAAKVLVQPGREIPNDTVIVMRPDEVVSTIPNNLPAGVPLVRNKGTLVPLGQEQ